ncbi:WXG100 family type VII secretion target [Mycolicibacterium vinylchloridicum]|uniref:WXG100 family type VII secretion target n=1 Tax=Mycolicibacterium vinylchloridicum TaxID=2736928 RepID=UPI00022E3005|nr:WXG100 family type VII secretion target [Mycolicibacterium vinylchloridicum]EHB46359.1 EsaT-6 like protein EsxP [Mycolicibacterium rhodesiae JS60]
MSNFMTDPAAMRDYSGRFANHASNITSDAQKAYASSTGIAGAGWDGDANTTSLGTVEEMMRAFRNIENQMHFASDNLRTSADTYEQQEHANAAALKS